MRASVVVGMAAKLLLVLASLVTGVIGVPARADAQDDISISIEKHAQGTSDGGVTFLVKIECGALPGTADFREALAGAGQEKTGAAAEGGIGPDVVCDSIERAYTAGVSLITDAAFKRGPAVVQAAVIACNTVGDDQVCVHEATQGRAIISGRAIR